MLFDLIEDNRCYEVLNESGVVKYLGIVSFTM